MVTLNLNNFGVSALAIILRHSDPELVEGEESRLVIEALIPISGVG